MKDLKHENLSKEIRSNFQNFILSSDDLLYFLKYYQAKLSFSAGFRKCLTEWYDKRSPSELLELVFATPKNEHARHIDIIKLLHPNLENSDKVEIVKAAFMSYEEIQKGAKQSTTLRKILKYQDLKACQAVHEVVSILKRKDFIYKLNHLPTFALKHAEIVELILPNLSLKEVLGCLTSFWNNNLLQSDNPISRKICNALKCNNKILKESKVNPLYVFGVLKTLEYYIKGQRRLTAKEVSGPPPNTFINAKLMSIVNMSFNERAATGCRYYVTIDLRKFSKARKKPSFKCTTPLFHSQLSNYRANCTGNGECSMLGSTSHRSVIIVENREKCHLDDVHRR